MPDYTFQVIESDKRSDTVIAECESMTEVRHMAIRALTDAAKDSLPRNSDLQQFKVVARDESRRIIYSATLSLVGAWDPPNSQQCDIAQL